MATIGIEVRTECPKCAAVVFVRGLAPRTTCDSCRTEVPLEEALAFLGEERTWDRLLAGAGPDDPTCGTCDAKLPVPADLGEGRLVCSCGAATRVREAPGATFGLPAFVTHVIGEDAGERFWLRLDDVLVRTYLDASTGAKHMAGAVLMVLLPFLAASVWLAVAAPAWLHVPAWGSWTIVAAVLIGMVMGVWEHRQLLDKKRGLIRNRRL